GVWKLDEVNHIAIARKGKALQVFVNGREYFNQNNVFVSGVTYYPLFRAYQWYENAGMYITNLRVGANAPNAVKDFGVEGKFVTNAIYFDTASSKIKAESWATLNNAAQAIKGTDGIIKIVGHTDSDGADDANLILSQKRAASVKNALVNEFGIDASRLITDGMGESQPITDNKTAVGKAQNRRVEFIKQ
ncbi:MAG: OmpA family protein, partial [Weeksellaceae bacterium]|nr:OmpA family protein [Weeksellaceae bacterium]